VQHDVGLAREESSLGRSPIRRCVRGAADRRGCLRLEQKLAAWRESCVSALEDVARLLTIEYINLAVDQEYEVESVPKLGVPEVRQFELAVKGLSGGYAPGVVNGGRGKIDAVPSMPSSRQMMKIETRAASEVQNMCVVEPMKAVRNE
jgi:hypothetical protein